MLERIKALCKERKITVQELEAALGFGNGTIGHWKTSTPKEDKITLVAQYFNVSVAYLTGASAEKNPATEGGLPDDEQMILDAYRNGSDEFRAMLMAQAVAAIERKKAALDK